MSLVIVGRRQKIVGSSSR